MSFIFIRSTCRLSRINALAGVAIYTLRRDRGAKVIYEYREGGQKMGLRENTLRIENLLATENEIVLNNHINWLRGTHWEGRICEIGNGLEIYFCSQFKA